MRDMQSLNISTKRQLSSLKADILLVTVTEVEALAVLAIFAGEIGQEPQRHPIGDNTYYDLGMLDGVRIVMVQSGMGIGGPCGTLLIVEEAIRALTPSASIMVGIAFGFDDHRQHIGDILVSQQLLGYELQKIATSHVGEIENIPRRNRPEASMRLLDRFRSGVLDWHGPTVEMGLICSGDKLIDNVTFRDQLLKFAPEAIGGEMEGIGLYSAAQRKKVDWIVVKAICDWADGNKKEDKETLQRLAAENAARFTLHVIKQGGIVEKPTIIAQSEEMTNKGGSTLVYERGRLIRKFDVHASYVICVDWEPDGTRIASAAGDGTVRVWVAESGESLLTYRGQTRLLNKANIQSTIYTVVWSPEGLRIVSGGSGTKVYVWNAATGQTLALYEGHSGLLPDVFTAVWSPDGKRIASACSSAGLDKTIHIWDSLTGHPLSRIVVRSGIIPNFSVLSIAWSPDGTLIAATCDDRKMRVWNAETGKLAVIYAYSSSWASHIAWSPDSRYLASAHSDHTACLWDVSTGTNAIMYRAHTDSVRYVAWSPDGNYLATASNDGSVRIWEALTGKHVYTYLGHTDRTTSVAWSPDGTCIASGSNDKTVHIWQV
jgi:WD40 repeat protein/nucleoside phosphorylase